MKAIRPLNVVSAMFAVLCGALRTSAEVESAIVPVDAISRHDLRGVVVSQAEVVDVQTAYDNWITESERLRDKRYPGGGRAYVFNQAFVDLAALGEPALPFIAAKLRSYLSATTSGNEPAQAIDVYLSYAVLKIKGLTVEEVLGDDSGAIRMSQFAKAALRIAEEASQASGQKAEPGATDNPGDAQ